MDLMYFVYNGEFMEGTTEDAKERIVKTARWLKVGAMGKLHVIERRSGRIREVPVIGDRDAVLRKLHRMSVYCSGDRLYRLAKNSYFWRGMRADC